mmetsp:Transcript_32386/g.93145  ORF Transcript_32386/g.93145 Transcript_32386/m.93145 type:complete len:208 (-) Transcript_32386:272-895(-)
MAQSSILPMPLVWLVAWATSAQPTASSAFHAPLAASRRRRTWTSAWSAKLERTFPRGTKNAMFVSLPALASTWIAQARCATWTVRQAPWQRARAVHLAAGVRVALDARITWSEQRSPAFHAAQCCPKIERSRCRCRGTSATQRAASSRVCCLTLARVGTSHSRGIVARMAWAATCVRVARAVIGGLTTSLRLLARAVVGLRRGRSSW